LFRTSLNGKDYGPGSVSGWRILDNNVRTLDLANNAVFGEDIRNNSLTGDDVDESTLNVVQGTGKVYAGSDAVESHQTGDLVTVPNFGTFNLQCEPTDAVARFTPVSGLGSYSVWFDGNSNSGVIPYSFGTATSPDPAAFLMPSRSVIRLRIVKSGPLMATLELDVNQADPDLPCNYPFQLLVTS
jgi:hypothetical protein